MPRRFGITVLILILLGFTGVKVGALWPVKQPALERQTLSFNELSESHWFESLDPQQRVLWQRLAARLQKNSSDYEASLLKALLLFQTGRLNVAVAELAEIDRTGPQVSARSPGPR